MEKKQEIKKLIRKEAATVRDGISSELRFQKSSIIADAFIKLEEYKKAKNIFVYLSYRSEVDTRSIIDKMWHDGKSVYAPVSYPDGRMRFFKIAKMSDLKVGFKGIYEPDETKGLFEADVKPDVVVVPGLAFDRNGNRMGYGMGFYDRFFMEHSNSLKVALSFFEQIVNEIPTQTTDVRMDLIVTDKGVLKINV